MLHLVLSLIAIFTNICEANIFQERSTHNDNILIGRIIDGYNATANQFPWQVSVKMVNPITNRSTFCGGSIISREWILTAAHCIKGFPKFTIGCGSNLLNSPKKTFKTTIGIYHPKYNEETSDNDIGLIRLPEKLIYCLTIQPVRLPKKSQSSKTFVGFKARVCGWGKTSDASTVPSPNLKWVDVRVITNVECSVFYGPEALDPTTLCSVGWQRLKQGTCRGDSGGPLVINEVGIWTQIALVSFGSIDSCENGEPTGYVRTSLYLDWIKNNTGIAIRL